MLSRLKEPWADKPVVVDSHGVGLVLCEDLRVSMVHNSDIVMVGEQNIRRDGVVGCTQLAKAGDKTEC